MSHKKTTHEVIQEFKKIHGNLYNYEKVNYIGAQEKVCIICPIHGEFWQLPILHIRGANCPYCNEKKKQTKEQIIERFKNVHGDTYDYSKFIYTGIFNKSTIICKKHGEFFQDAHTHLRGSGCPKCGNIKRDNQKWLTQNQIIERFKNVHGDTYDYSKVKYTGINNKLCIICKKHGEFFQDAHTHLKGSGCPKCKNSKLENIIQKLLKKHNINYIYQYHNKIFGKQSIDFFLNDYNIGIECQGIQHYKPVKLFGGDEQYIKQQELDNKKLKICNDNNIKLIYFTYYKKAPKNENIFSSTIKLLKYILNEK